MANTKTTANVAAKKATKAPEKNHETETVAVTNSGDQIPSTTAEPANIAPATEIDTSGATQQIVPDVDLSHPAVDSNPREGTTIEQNRIDFNDPTMSGSDAVAKMLNEQGVPTSTDE